MEIQPRSPTPETSTCPLTLQCSPRPILLAHGPSTAALGTPLSFRRSLRVAAIEWKSSQNVRKHRVLNGQARGLELKNCTAHSKLVKGFPLGRSNRTWLRHPNALLPQGTQPSFKCCVGGTGPLNPRPAPLLLLLCLGCVRVEGERAKPGTPLLPAGMDS